MFTCRLRENNVKLKFVTNTTKESRRILYERLITLGFNIDINEIWSSIWATRNAIVSDALKPFLLVDNKALEDFSGKQYFIISKFEFTYTYVLIIHICMHEGMGPIIFLGKRN